MTIQNILTAAILTSFLLLASNGLAQENKNVTESGNTIQNSPRDNFYNRYLHTEKRVLEYDFVHEKDVFWEKRVWRLIDINEKMNHIFRNEKQPFIELIISSALAGDISLYHTVDDRFTTAFSKEEAKMIGGSIDTVCTFHPETFQDTCFAVFNEFNPMDVKKYRLKEVYYIDEETSNMKVRILGIAPILDRYDDNGNFLNSGPMFWVYYPEAREVFARTEAFNYHNDAARMTWENIFEARLFHSYIIKENNVYDRRLKDYITAPMAILLESDKIKDGIFSFEHDLWSY